LELRVENQFKFFLWVIYLLTDTIG
jgi:hypothetical protein